jgi:hypothetical protein
MEGEGSTLSAKTKLDQLFKIEKMRNFSVDTRGLGVVGAILLIAAVVLGLIAGIAYLNNIIQPELRDSKRFKDMTSIVKALESYHKFAGNYPVSSSGAQVISPDSNLSNLLLSTRSTLTRLPRDPLHPKYEYKYRTDSAGKDYTITFCLETENETYEIGCENFITNTK